MEGNILCFLELFANVEKVDLAAGHHDADQRSVVCTEALQRRSIVYSDSVTVNATVWERTAALMPRKYTEKDAKPKYMTCINEYDLCIASGIQGPAHQNCIPAQTCHV